MRGRSAAELDVETFDLRAPPPGFLDDPYPWYDALRRQAPVKRLPDGGVLLTRFSQVLEVYESPDSFSSDKKIEFGAKFGQGRLFRHHTTSLVFNDAPYHGRVRKLILGALVPRAIAAREAQIASLVRRLIDDLEARGGGDIIADFAAAIPVEVIGDLLQVPHEARGALRAWSLAILGALEPAPTPEALAAGETALEHFHTLLEALVAARRAKPLDPEADLLTRLILGGNDGARLSQGELLENCVFLLNAGHETTTNLIGNLLELLARFPDERRRLEDSPDLIRGAVEEGLRYESSNQLGNRLVSQDVEIGGQPLAAGTQVTLCIGAANRDPEAFDAADRFDIGRRLNRHLAFAAGPHQCAGMSLARMEARIAVDLFVRRLPGYSVQSGAIRGGRARFRGFKTLPFAA